MMFLGGHRITGLGWAGPQAVYVDFVSQHESGWLWQLYANRKLIGSTTTPLMRRIVGQLLPTRIPAPLTLVRVDEANRTTDYGALLPPQPWNRFRLRWSGVGLDSDTDHFDIIGATGPGVVPDPEFVLARVPYTGPVAYAFDLAPLSQSGAWQFGIVARDRCLPLGNAGDQTDVTIHAAVIPPDVRQDIDGNRFTLDAVEGFVTADFAY